MMATAPTSLLATALSGRRVVELSADIAGAHCGHALAGLGATVTCVRGHQQPAGNLDGGKQIALLDPGTAAGFEALVGLCATADLLIEERPATGWTTGEPWHLRLQARLPQLMVVCITPWGLTGPRADEPGFPLNVYHGGGNAQQIPCDLLRPEDRTHAPLQAGAHWGEAQAGTQAAIIAVACLLDTPRYAGAVLDCAKQEALISYNWTETVRHPNEGRSPSRLAPLATIVGGILPARDGHVQVAVREDHQWAGLAQLLGHAEWITDARWATRAARTDAAAAVSHLLAAETVHHAKLDLHRRGRDLGVPIAAVLTPDELLADADLAARGAWQDDAATGARRPRWDTQVTDFPDGTNSTAESGASASTADRAALRNRPLAGVRVLDFGWVAMGPYAGYVLAALGAEVIQIGRPPEAAGSGVDLGHYNYGFDTLNTGKTWVGLDLKQPEGIALVKQLVANCDVVLDNFRPGVMRRLGLDQASLAALNPRIVSLSATTYGHAGSGGPWIGYAPVFSALAGLAHFTGYPDGPPAEVSHPVDFYAGSVGILGVLAGLHRRNTTGRGCHIDLAAREAVSWSLGHDLIGVQRGQWPHARLGNDHPHMAPHGAYPCAGENRWISIAVDDTAAWQALCTCMGASDLAKESALQSAAGRCAQRARIDVRITQWTSGQERDAVHAALRAAGVAAQPSANSADLWADPQLRARGIFGSRDDRGTTRWYVHGPWHIKGEARGPLVTRQGRAALEAVFGDIAGLSAVHITRLIERGILAQR